MGSNTLSPGARWGNLEILKAIGESGASEVYLARDLWLGHQVALKVLTPPAGELPKALHAARMLVRVRHRHVVTVHGADVHDGRLGFWMDYVDGLTLSRVIQLGGRRSAGEAVAWGQELCRALAAVHAAGLVHRDVRAQNVMRQAGDGRLILMDFRTTGVSDLFHLADGAAAQYMAPELLSGGPATRSSDIYALGVLLFHVVSKQFPCPAETLDELRGAHERGLRVRLEDVRPDLPFSFVEVVERALRREPSVRYAGADEMLAALRAGTDTRPFQSTPLVPRPVGVDTPAAAPGWVRSLHGLGSNTARRLGLRRHAGR
jgi:eukaryotic-like serine/threonine-protein kinase